MIEISIDIGLLFRKEKVIFYFTKDHIQHDFSILCYVIFEP